MTESGHLEIASAEAGDLHPPVNEMAPDTCNLSSSAAQLARNLAWLPGQLAARPFRHRCRILSRAFKPLLAALESPPGKSVSDDFRLLRENILLLESELEDIGETFKQPNKLPQVRTPDGAVVPRIAALAEDFLAAAAYPFSVASFSDYIQAFQEITVLNMAELWALIPALKLVLLEQIAEHGRHLLDDPIGSYGV